MTAPTRDHGDTWGIAPVATLSPGEVAEVNALCDAATDEDGVRPLSEHVTLHLRHGGEGLDRHLLLRDPDAVLVGYAHLDPTDVVAGPVAEVVVHPSHRRHGYGRELVTAALAAVGDGRLRLWAHGDHPGARALAATTGFRETRQLWQMRRSLWAPLPAPSLPGHLRLRSFRPGDDEADWLRVNARAFADHPEQGSWTLTDLQARMEESWFDPEGFLVAEDGSGEMAAFHWTKVHGEESGDLHGHGPIGELYVVGVDPSAQGQGLGRAMTVAGLRWLRSRGLAQAMLYVDADNAPALALYRSLGFVRWDTDVMFRRASTPPGT
ncbi:MAG: mycothiol synthase [Actinomycetales bacterium]|nr:mycothiol synthase [Actinomycetales bacterium]